MPQIYFAFFIRAIGGEKYFIRANKKAPNAQANDAIKPQISLSASQMKTILESGEVGSFYYGKAFPSGIFHEKLFKITRPGAPTVKPQSKSVSGLIYSLHG